MNNYFVVNTNERSKRSKAEYTKSEQKSDIKRLVTFFTVFVWDLQLWWDSIYQRVPWFFSVDTSFFHARFSYAVLRIQYLSPKCSVWSVKLDLVNNISSLIRILVLQMTFDCCHVFAMSMCILVLISTFFYFCLSFAVQLIAACLY